MAYANERGVVRTKRTWLAVGSSAFTLVGFIPLLAGVTHALDTQGHGVLVLMLVAGYYTVFAGSFLAWTMWWLERRGHLQADEGGLSLDGKRLILRSEIRHGTVVRHGGRNFLRLRRPLRDVDVEVVDEDEARHLLHAMRLDGDRSVAHYWMFEGTRRNAWLRVSTIGLVPLVSLVLGWMHILGWLDAGWPKLALPALWVASAVFVLPYALNRNISITVGADGIRVRRLLGRPRFLAFTALESAETDGRDMAIRLRGGDVLRMHHWQERWHARVFGKSNDDGALLARLESQISKNRGVPENAVVTPLARGARSTREWVRDVVLASDEHASFRSPAIPAETLWRIVEDPAATQTARAGAAIALRSRLDDAGRGRLCAVAESCAAPRLRVALEGAASAPDDDTLARLLEPLDDEAGGTPSPRPRFVRR